MNKERAYAQAAVQFLEVRHYQFVELLVLVLRFCSVLVLVYAWTNTPHAFGWIATVIAALNWMYTARLHLISLKMAARHGAAGVPLGTNWLGM